MKTDLLPVSWVWNNETTFNSETFSDKVRLVAIRIIHISFSWIDTRIKISCTSQKPKDRVTNF